MFRFIFAAVLCGVAFVCCGTVSEARQLPIPSLDEMLKRDRFAQPGAELDAWLAYREQVSENKTLALSIRAQVALRVGTSYFYTADYEQALKELDAAEKAAAAADNLPASFWPELYSYRALSLADSRRFDDALMVSQKALKEASVDSAAVHSHTPTELTALALNAAGYTAYKAGNLSRAQDYMCQAACDARQVLALDAPLRHLNANNCGVFLFFLDDESAASMLETAATNALAHLPNDHPIMGQSLNTSYAVLYQLGYYPEAATLARTHMDLEIRLRGPDSNRVYDPASMLSKALAAQGALQDAADVQRQVIALADRMRGAGDFRAKGVSRIVHARLLDRLGRSADARGYFIAGLAELEKAFTQESAEYALARIDYALHLAEQGQYDIALPLARQAHDTVSNLLGPDHMDAVITALKYGILLARDDQVDIALTHATPRYETLKLKLLTLTKGRAGRVSTSAQLSQGFAAITEIALEAGDRALALEALQLASASELSLASADVRARAIAQDAGLEALVTDLKKRRYAEAQAQKDLDARLNSVGGGKSVAALAKALAQAKLDTAQIETQIARKFPAFADMSISTPVSAEALMGSLRSDQAIVLPLYSFNKALTVAITQKEVLWERSSVSPFVFDQLRNTVLDHIATARLSRTVDISDFNAENAHQLFKAVFPGDLYQCLEAQSHFLFVSSGPLAEMPSAVMVTQPQRGKWPSWLVDDKALSVISRFNDLDGPLDTLGKTQFVGLGDPTLAPTETQSVDTAKLFRSSALTLQSLRELPSLPGANAELKAMRKAFGRKNTQLFTGAAFNKTTVTQIDFTNAAVVAFATHGMTGNELVGLREPALVLTPPTTPGEADNGLLLASDIAQMAIPADWVILSACNSGLGRSASAPMYSGLAKAFRTAGANALLLSHWPVRDDVAAVLSIETIKNHRKGMGKAQALQKAQRDLMRSRRIKGAAHPALWAPFVLIEN